MLVIGVGTCVAPSLMATPVEAAAQDYTFKMWIAPIECTRNTISDGVTTNVILTPKECDDLLHPPVKPDKPGVRPSPVPNAPDTGRFSDIWTTSLMGCILVVFGISVIILIVRDLQRLRSKRLQK